MKKKIKQLKKKVQLLSDVVLYYNKENISLTF